MMPDPGSIPGHLDRHDRSFLQKIEERDLPSESKIFLKSYPKNIPNVSDVKKFFLNVSSLESSQFLTPTHFCAFEQIYSVALPRFDENVEKSVLVKPYGSLTLVRLVSVLSIDHFYLLNFNFSIGYKYGHIDWKIAEILMMKRWLLATANITKKLAGIERQIGYKNLRLTFELLQKEISGPIQPS
ncbi:hypothetical protein L596_029235 [Steinernema carpocapsae]|uniref:Uncharacterized protein n=1 Tax=Steinernema carpocapsae TaxID=34508 RepID=A0A4U5LU17_STECR|nr:hypothetical protein L596_029235 [Steinernema carpocapsae]